MDTTVSKKHTTLKQHTDVKLSKGEYIIQGEPIKSYEYRLPDKKSYLVVVPWPATVPKPVFDNTARYHNIKIFGKETTQPRKTICYGISYKYSGAAHKLDETPDDVQLLMDITYNLYKTKNVEMQCLANQYGTGQHCIHKHSDDKVQFSPNKDVVCWVTGAPRRIIIRPKKKTEIILSIVIPEGIYIMKGDKFQTNYTFGSIRHESYT